MPICRSIVFGYCLLNPYEHVGSFGRVDEDTISELRRFKKCLNRIFEIELDEAQCIFVETALKPDSAKAHTQLECIPIPKNDFELMPAYFKVGLVFFS